jgi:hypothetical protein
VLFKVNNCLAMSRQVKVTLRRDDDDIRFVLD